MSSAEACWPCSTSPTNWPPWPGDADLVVAVEELLRWVSPIKNMARTVTRDLVMRDQQLHEGDQLILFYPSANRDEDVFESPHLLDIRRQPNPHIAFGFGTHFCLGAALARLELRVMFGEVLRRMPDLHVVGSELPYRASNFRLWPRGHARSIHPERAGDGVNGPFDGVVVVELANAIERRAGEPAQEEASCVR